MRSGKQQRIERVRQALAPLPVLPSAVLRAFEHFCKTGELPDHQRLAADVCRHAMGDRYIANRVDTGRLGRRSVREHLFEDAIYGEGLGRFAARELLHGYVRSGCDVTDQNFLADKTLPKHASVGMHLVGFPEFLVQSPYVAQARRLLQRFDVLRARIAQEPRTWSKTFDAAWVSLRDYREVPTDELLRDALMATVEMNGLILHMGGRDVSKVMAACDKAAKAKGDSRAAAYAEVAALADPRRGGEDDEDE